MRSKELDGQMNLFGSEPYRPKKAGNEEEHRVELDTEAEEFLSVGRRKKQDVQRVKAEPKKKRSGGWNVVMQRSYSGVSGQTVTTAYVDYNLVYVEDSDGNISMTHYGDSKKAVDRYLKEIERFEKSPELKRSENHPALKNVTIREDGEL